MSETTAHLCPGCGVVALPGAERCGVCGRAAPAGGPALAERDDGRVWAQVRASFECRQCGRPSPIDHLDVDGQLECLYCGLRQGAVDQLWDRGLRFAHEVADLAGPDPEGRHSDPEHSIASRNPHKEVGVSQWCSVLERNEGAVASGKIRAHDLSLQVAPGAPVCECGQALEVQIERRGHLKTHCAACGASGTYVSPAPALDRCPTLWGVLAAESRTDRAAVRTSQPQAGGAVAIQCPQCGAALEITAKDRSASCQFCGTAARVPLRLRAEVFEADLEAEPWWVLFDGISERRGHLLAKARKAKAREQQREHDAQRRAQEGTSRTRRAEQRTQRREQAAAARKRNAIVMGAVGLAITGAVTYWMLVAPT